MAAVDAQFYWMSAKIPNDEFLLYAFDGEPADYPAAADQLRRRADAEPALSIRVRDRGRTGCPRPSPPEQVVRHELAEHSWDGCLAAVAGLADDQLDLRRMAWRLHVFGPVHGIPGVRGPGTVRPAVRPLVRHRAQLPGPTATVAVLGAVAQALSDLAGDQADSLGAEVPMAKPGAPQAYNHFGNVVVDLHPRLGAQARAERIAAGLAAGRRRFEHPATRAADRAFAAVPAALLRWGVDQFDADQRPDQVAGNTVVSSVNRGPADLSFGGARVVLTAGYPALSPVMGLTHGVHGIGDTIAISVHAAASAVPDVDAYLALLDAAL